MKTALFPRIRIRQADYDHIDRCPLCRGSGTVLATLARKAYRFGPVTVPLPAVGVRLMLCDTCDLLYKDRIPTSASLASVLNEAAEQYWQVKPGAHPRAAEVQRYMNGGSLLDIGASNGDLLRSVQGSRLSAFDAVAYDACRQHVTGEYIISGFEHTDHWSGKPYDVVSAFDVFEHFLRAREAIGNIAAFLKPGAQLIVETGNWRSVEHPEDWYYTNLFEHQIFWSRTSLASLSALGLELVRCDETRHKALLRFPLHKQIVVGALRALRFVPGAPALVERATGVDPRLLALPRRADHVFAVLRAAGGASAASEPAEQAAG